MKKKKVLLLLLTGCLLLTSCKNEIKNPTSAASPTQENQTDNTETNTENTVSKNDTASTEETKEESSNTLKEDSLESPINIIYNEEEQSYKTDNDEEFFFYYLSYPVVEMKDDSKSQDLINTDINKKIEEFKKQRDENLIQAEEYYEIAKENENHFSSSNYYNYSEQRVDKDIISFVCQNSFYMGGAHGNTIFTGYNYDTKTGKFLTLDDIFYDKADSMAQIREHVLFLAGLPYYQDLLFPDYEDSIDSILVEDYWYLAVDGLHFISNPYMLGPYAAGRFDFIVPYEKIPGLKEEYQLDTYLLRGSLVGEPISSDLDGDNLEDTIIYDVLNPFATYGISEDGAMEPTFSLEINGANFSEYLTSSAGYISDNFCNQYYVVDLDTSDTYKELMIVDYNYNDYHMSHFFRYENNSLLYLGTVPDSPVNKSFYINGDGMVHSRLWLNLLQTSWVNTTYELVDGVLSPIPTDWYVIDESNWNEEYKKHNILQDVIVHTEPNLESETIILTPSDGPVSFPATDNEHWYQIKAEDGQVYYLYMTDFSTVPNGGVDMNASDIFENLFLAG